MTLGAPSRVLVLTRSGCHLCEEAERVAAAVCGELGVGWALLDVDSDEDLRLNWTDHVPVTFVDETLHGRWFLDGAKLRQALEVGTPRPMPASWRPPGHEPN